MSNRKIFLFCITILFVLVSNAYSQIVQTYMVEMRDGVKLATDLYLPSDFTDSLPALLVRTPYNKEGNDMKDIGNYMSQSYTIAVVIQDVRGRFASEGDFCFFRCDGSGDQQDGVDTVNWIRNQVWSNSKVVTYGGSALGIAQYLLASTGIDLSAMVVEVATPDLYSDISFQNGCFRKSDVESWLNYINESQVLSIIKSHILYDDFWDVLDVTDDFSKVNIPAIHRGGWFDMFLKGTIDAFIGYQKYGGPGARGKQKLIIGPWTHGGVPLESTKVGDLIFPPNAKDIPQEWISMVLIWLNHYMGTQPDQDYIDNIPSVIYYTMGDVKDTNAPGNEWRTAEDWPVKAANIRFYLDAEGRLSERCPMTEGSFSQYVYDPADPVPTVGGNNLYLEAGPKEQSSIEHRSDVLLFTTDILNEPMEITGNVKAHIFVSIDQIDTDIMVRLLDVYPDGKSYLIMDGAQRLAAMNSKRTLNYVTPGAIIEVVVDLWSTSIILNKGHRLRIVVSSSNYPRFERNFNDGSSYGGNGILIPVKVKVYHNPMYRSYIELPDPNKSEADINYCISGEDAGFDVLYDNGTVEDIMDVNDLGNYDEGHSDTLYEDYREDDGILSDGDITDTQIVNDAALLDRGVIEDILIDSDLAESETSSSGCSCSIH